MGRKPEPLKNRKTNNFIFTYPLQDPAAFKDMETFQEWCKREGMDFNKGIRLAIKETIERHQAGNYQTLIPSFEEGGVKSDGQLEQEIIQKYLTKNGQDIPYREILRDVKAIGYKGIKAAQAATRIAYSLNQVGKKVWR